MLTSLSSPAILSLSQLLLLVFLRVLPLVTFSPLFGGEAIPRRLRTGIAAVFSIVMVLPLARMIAPPQTLGVMAILMAKEFVIGLVLAILVTMVFDAFASMGALIDLSRGSTLSSVFDPIRGNRDSALAVFMPLLAITLFVTMGGYRLILSGLGESFTLVPPFSLPASEMLSQSRTMMLLEFCGQMFVLSIRMAMPVIALLLLIDVAMALVNRFSPQIEVFFLASESKGWLGLLMLLLSLSAIGSLMPQVFRALIHQLEHWLQL